MTILELTQKTQQKHKGTGTEKEARGRQNIEKQKIAEDRAKIEDRVSRKWGGG